MLNKKALAGTPSTPPVFVEDVFSTYLWDGNSTARNIVNGIDLAGKGGLVWTKYRNATASNRLYDTNRGATKQIFSDLTNAEQVAAQSLTAFNTDGFSLGTGQPNETTATVVGWTFRKQAKFFDVVTYTGNGTARTIAHNLGSVPGCMFVKRTSTAKDWAVYHRSTGNTKYLALNSTQAESTAVDYWNNTTPTSTVFTVGIDGDVNANGETYVAYLFAHDAGGFGTAGTDNVISCGSYTGNGSTTNGVVTTLGYEPQFLLIKSSSSTTFNNWFMFDTMRGMPVDTGDNFLYANTSAAESAGGAYIIPTATGFVANHDVICNASGVTYIYIAIRRGPMKTPTSGTSVYNAAFGSSTTVGYTAGFPVDLAMTRDKDSTSFTWATSRLTGQMEVYTNSTSAESDGGTNTRFDFMTGWHFPNQTADRISWMFKRAPGFMDVVCYTGTGSNRTVTHNLGAVPELMIVKNRSDATGRAWAVYAGDNTDYLVLNTTAATADDNTYWNDTSPTSSVFSVGTNDSTNESSDTFVAYLFATVAGVSKVGSYTGNGGTQAIACGFTGGARFVLIKRTDSTGDWYVYDTARGMTLLTDPYLRLNSTAAETATLGSVTTTTGGFTVDATILAAINTNTASYIFLAIA